MKRRLAARLKWGLPVVWVAGDEQLVLVQATVVHVIHSLPDRPERDQVRQVGAGREQR